MGFLKNKKAKQERKIDQATKLNAENVLEIDDAWLTYMVWNWLCWGKPVNHPAEQTIETVLDFEEQIMQEAGLCLGMAHLGQDNLPDYSASFEKIGAEPYWKLVLEHLAMQGVGLDSLSRFLELTEEEREKIDDRFEAAWNALDRRISLDTICADYIRANINQFDDVPLLKEKREAISLWKRIKNLFSCHKAVK